MCDERLLSTGLIEPKVYVASIISKVTQITCYEAEGGALDIKLNCGVEISGLPKGLAEHLQVDKKYRFLIEKL